MRTRLVAACLALLAAVGCAGPAPADAPPVRITVDRADVLADERVAVVVDGLEPGGEVTVWARRVDGLGRPWLAHATFTADVTGRVGLETAEPSTGTYGGVDGMGLFRSVALADGAAAQPQFPVGATEPFTLSAVVAGEVVATTVVRQRVVAAEVTRREVREPGVVGVLYEPPGPGPHPAVVVLGGSEGGVPDYPLASMLASHGFATLALAYFRADGLPPELARIPLEYFVGAVDWLRAQPGVEDGRVGVTGASRGGELALLLGATYPERIDAVVATVPSGLVTSGLTSATSSEPVAAWTLAGRDVPFVLPPPDPATVVARYVVPAFLGTPVVDVAGTWPDYQRLDPAVVAAATIPVERITGPVLLVSGTDDRLWPSTQLARIAQDRLDRAAGPWPHEHLALTGAGHFIFGNAPYSGPFPVELGSQYGALTGGGTPAANAAAVEVAWPHVLDTFRIANEEDS